MKLLVTGFAPFNGETVNPSYQIVQRLPDKIGDAEVTRLELPVEFGRAGRLLAREVERVKPVLVLCLGQAGGRAGISLEQVGINLREASIPDNAGAQPSGEPVVPGGPAAYFTTLPIKRMCMRIREMGIPASISYSAGTYVCNDLLYSLLDELEKRHPGIRLIPRSKQRGKQVLRPALRFRWRFPGFRLLWRKPSCRMEKERRFRRRGRLINAGFNTEPA